MYCFRRRRIWGSKLHAGYSIPLRISNGALIGDDVKKNRVRPYYNGYMTGAAWEWFQLSFIIVTPCLWFLDIS